jgi:hypothetical protein
VLQNGVPQRCSPKGGPPRRSPNGALRIEYPSGGPGASRKGITKRGPQNGAAEKWFPKGVPKWVPQWCTPRGSSKGSLNCGPHKVSEGGSPNRVPQRGGLPRDVPMGVLPIVVDKGSPRLESYKGLA